MKVFSVGAVVTTGLALIGAVGFVVAAVNQIAQDHEDAFAADGPEEPR